MSIPGKWKRMWKDPEAVSCLEYLSHSKELSMPGAGRDQTGNRTCLGQCKYRDSIDGAASESEHKMLKGRTRNTEPPERSICGKAAAIPRAENKAWGMEPCGRWVRKEGSLVGAVGG